MRFLREPDLRRFSDRLPWSAPKNAYSLLLLERRLSGSSLLDLTCANPTEAFADYPHQDIAGAFGAIADFQYEPDPFGSLSARRVIVDWYATQGIRTDANRIALTASTSEAYSILFKLLCDPGEEILIPSPSYPLFEYLARAEGVRTTPYQLVYDGGWFVDFESIRNAISPRTKAIVVVNPNNPTGSFLKKREVSELMEVAARHGLALISDEVFMNYAAVESGDQVRSLIGHDDAVLSFSLNGLSKEAGMPQMKIAWIVVSGQEKEASSALMKLELLLDSYLSVGTPVQRVLGELLRIGFGIRAKIGSRLRENREALSALAGSPARELASEGGWSVILQVPRVRTEEAWITSLLAEYGVVVQPGYFYDMANEAFLVVSLISPPEIFSAGIGRLRLLANRS
jgi:alanine-synthesizing transaminase